MPPVDLLATPHFRPALFKFLKELKQNNDRAWFAENKERFVDDVETPMRQFIADLSTRMREINSNFVADPRRQGGSMFRIYRDTRFSKDKSPFKTAVAAQFRHNAKKKAVSLPGFYLHLEPGDCVAGGGIYAPDSESLAIIRERIATKPKEWAAVAKAVPDLGGSTLKRVPAGFDPEHPHAEALKHKDFYSMVSFSEKQVTAPDFLDQFIEVCIEKRPLVLFIAKALDLKV